jgi:adenylate kinase
MLNIIIFGAPGSGKGTQSALLKKKYNLLHISTGDMLRAEIAAGTELGKLANSYITQGHLVPDEVIIDMLSEKLEQRDQNNNGIIFDGFPRTVAQAEALETMLAGHGEAIDCMLEIDVEEQELISRLLKRGQESGRSDDNLETIQNRLQVYRHQTAPVMGYYGRAGKYCHVEGNGTIDDIFGRIAEKLDSYL